MLNVIRIQRTARDTWELQYTFSDKPGELKQGETQRYDDLPTLLEHLQELAEEETPRT